MSLESFSGSKGMKANIRDEQQCWCANVVCDVIGGEATRSGSAGPLSSVQMAEVSLEVRYRRLRWL